LGVLLLLFVLILLLGMLLLLCGLLVLLLRGLRLLMLLPLLRFALLLTLLLMLCAGRDRSSEKQEQNCCADNPSSFHLSVLLFERECSVAAQSFFIMLVGCRLRVCPKRITSPDVPVPFSETSKTPQISSFMISVPANLVSFFLDDTNRLDQFLSE